MAYAIVLFSKTDEVATVCSKWIIHSEPKQCRWPPNICSATGIRNCLLLDADPTGWPSYDVRILCPDIGECVTKNEIIVMLLFIMEERKCGENCEFINEWSGAHLLGELQLAAVGLIVIVSYLSLSSFIE